VIVQGAGGLAVHDTEIHAGSTSGTATGVALVSAVAASIVDDTIYTGSGSGSAITIEAGVQYVTVTDDLLLGSGATSQSAVNLPACQQGQLNNLDHTAFVNFATLYACGTTLAATVAAMAAALPSAGTAGDVEIGSTGACATPGACVADPSCPSTPTTCIPSILGASWTSGDDGTSGLFNGSPGSSSVGWTLPAGATLCALARGGTPYTGITTDVSGQARDPSKPTIGAFEYTSSSCN
jgi:hypothetical protein